MVVICSHFNEMSKYQEKVAGGMHGSRPRTVSSPIPLQRSPRPVSPGQHFITARCMISLLLSQFCLSVHLCLSVVLSSVSLPVHLSVWLCLSVILFISRSAFYYYMLYGLLLLLPGYLYFCLSFCLTDCMSICLCLSVCLSFCHNGGPCHNSSDTSSKNKSAFWLQWVTGWCISV